MRFTGLVRRLGGAWLLMAGVPIMASAYELDTHQQLSQAAFDASGLASTLQSAYGIFPKDTFRGRFPLFMWERNTPVNWITKGARDEDWLTRPLNHFYDPYHDAPLGIAAKAPDWALEDVGDLAGQDYSYKDARDAFYRGLTARDPATHERELGDTFYALGHIIHLIQDMAQPQHTRNDSHPNFIPVTKSWMETYIERLAGRPDFNTLFELNVDPDSVPNVTRARDLWVTGTGAQMTGSGMAEFSNANFVSAGTNFTALQPFATADRFPSPVLDLNNVSTSSFVDVCKDGAPAPGGALGYLTFYGNGFNDPVTGGRLDNPRMTTYSLFDQYLAASGRPPTFALNCFNLDKAADILLPRAVSYSAALLQYFFRGRLEIAPPARDVYGLAAFQPGNTGKFTKLRFKVRNATLNEQAGPGQMTAVVRYRTPIDPSVSLIDTPLADISGPRFAVSQPLDPITPTSSFQELVFDFTQSPVPTNSADLFLTVVFKGPLGQEDAAVMVGGKDLYEPDPLDRANATDYDCFQGVPYHVADSTAYPPYRRPDQIQRDVNGDGVRDLDGPWVEHSLYIKTFDRNSSAPTLPEDGFDFKVAELLAGQYVRFMLLQDQELYRVALREAIQEVPTGEGFPNHSFAVVLNGILNEVFPGPAGETVRRVTLSAIDRGVPFFHKIALLNSDPTSCLSQMHLLTPDLERVEGCLPVADCRPVE